MLGDSKLANPQTENGFTRIANELMEAMCRVNLSPYESRVLWFIIRKTYGFNKKLDRIALSQFAKKTGIDRRNVHRALKGLSAKRMIVIRKDDMGFISYGLQKDYSKWRLSSIKMTVISRDGKVSSKETTKLSSVGTPTKDNNKDTIKDNVYSTEFLRFWNAYPKKRSKGKAFQVWKNLKPSKELLEKIIQAIEVQKKCPDWKRDSGQYIPYPATWLSGRRWEDDIEQESKQNGTEHLMTADELRRQRGE